MFLHTGIWLNWCATNRPYSEFVVTPGRLTTN